MIFTDRLDALLALSFEDEATAAAALAYLLTLE
jgi:hypothetical protein